MSVEWGDPGVTWRDFASPRDEVDVARSEGEAIEMTVPPAARHNPRSWWADLRAMGDAWHHFDRLAVQIVSRLRR